MGIAQEVTPIVTTPYFPLSPHELNTWLSWAGRRLVALPVRNLWPSRGGCFWPDYLHDEDDCEIYLPTNLRFPPPTKDEIPIMDEILLLPSTCLDIYQRRILHMRALNHPLTEKPFNSWLKIARKLHTYPQHIKRLHAKGLEISARKADMQKVNLIRAFLLP